jgi:hypothetical protein
MSKGHRALKFLRKVHLYLGIFTTPALLFFAITGALQTFSMHETTQGSNYKPPAWIRSLAQLHKKQTTQVPPRRARPVGSENARGERQRGDPASRGAAIGPTDGTRTTSSGAAVPTQAQPGSSRQPKAGEASGQSASSAPQTSHLPMKMYFLLVSLSLVTSTLTGIYMSYKYSRGWWVLTGLLVAGVAVPLLLLPF